MERLDEFDTVDEAAPSTAVHATARQHLLRPLVTEDPHSAAVTQKMHSDAVK